MKMPLDSSILCTVLLTGRRSYTVFSESCVQPAYAEPRCTQNASKRAPQGWMEGPLCVQAQGRAGQCTLFLGIGASGMVYTVSRRRGERGSVHNFQAAGRAGWCTLSPGGGASGMVYTVSGQQGVSERVRSFRAGKNANKETYSISSFMLTGVFHMKFSSSPMHSSSMKPSSSTIRLSTSPSSHSILPRYLLFSMS